MKQAIEQTPAGFAMFGRSGSVSRKAARIAILLTIIAVVVRLPCFTFRSHDYVGFLEPWTQYLRANGHFLGIATIESDYTAPYLYFLGLISYLPSALTIYAIKAVQCVFDFVCAYYAGKIVMKASGKPYLGVIAYCAVLFVPTVILNSAAWAQCDATYTALLLIMLWNFMQNRPRLALIFFGVALSLKLQSIFLLPFVIYLFIDRRFKLYEALYSVLSFLALQIPAWILGAPISRSFGVYITQAAQYDSAFTYNAPSIYALFPQEAQTELRTLGMVLLGILGAIGVCAVAALLFFLLKRRFSDRSLVLLFLFCGLAIPFLLPRMHERYFFVAEVAVVIYACLNPKRWWSAILVIAPACVTYLYCMLFAGAPNNDSHLRLPALALLLGTAAVLVSKWLVESILSDPRRAGIDAPPELAKDGLQTAE